MDKIVIRDLEVRYRVGVPDAERAQPQRLLISVEIDTDFAAAARSDDLERTLDYDAVCRRLSALGEGRSWRLIETLAYDIANLLRSEFHAQKVVVEVKKFILPEARYVAVRTEQP